jgi:hypothetical protein
MGGEITRMLLIPMEILQSKVEKPFGLENRVQHCGSHTRKLVIPSEKDFVRV